VSRFEDGSLTESIGSAVSGEMRLVKIVFDGFDGRIKVFQVRCVLKLSKAVTELVGSRRGSSGAHQNRVGWVLAAGGRRVVYCNY
jgi:hypothetical protein